MTDKHDHDYIPVNTPEFKGNEIRYLTECIETGWISSEGQFVGELEAQLARHVGRQHGIAVSSGSAGLDVAISALGIGPGDEVIVPTFTIISCVSAIVRAGALPVLVDLCPDTWTMDIGQIKNRITSKTKAIMVVHIYGLPSDMDEILSLADRHGLLVIEDAAEMIGQNYNGKPCGSFGDLSIFSFYANKPVTSGEGGMVLTDDAAIATRCKSLRNLCFQPEQRFVHNELGWNFRMSNLQAAVALAQYEQLETTIETKRKIANRYNYYLRDVSGIELPPQRCSYAESIYWVYGVVLNDHLGIDASVLISRLGQCRIGTRPFFWPMHEQPVFRSLNLFKDESFPVSERLARRGLYLPNSTSLSDTQIIQVVRSLIASIDIKN